MNSDSFQFNKPNVAFICFSESYGGLELSVLRIASKLRERNFRCTIIIPPNTPLAQFASEENFQIEFVKPLVKYGDIFSAYKIAHIFRKQKIDFAIIMQSKDIHLVALAKTIYPSTRIYFYQEMQSGIDKMDIIHTWMFSKLSKWITLTHKMKREALIHTKVSENKIEVIPIGIDLLRFNPALYNKQEERKNFSLPLDKKIIGAIGRIDPLKGQKELILAIPSIIQKYPDTNFVFVGDATPGQNEFKISLHELCQKLEIQSYVNFIPFTNKIPELLSTFDIFILPSHCETFGFVLLEAMAMGIPVIGTNAGGVPEIITHGVNGLLVPPCNLEAISVVIQMLLKSPELCNRLSLQAQEDVQKKFNIETTVDKLISILRDDKIR